MDDDFLSFSPDGQHLGSPIASQSSLGDRITWGPSASSILANIPRPKHTVLPYRLPNVQSVKRSSVNAGLGSPTRPGAGGEATTSDLTGSSAGCSNISTTTSARLAKRSRRTRQSTSASCLVFGNPSSGHSPAGRSQSLDMTTDAMFGELEKRLQARQDLAVAQRAEKERLLRLQTENQENQCLSVTEKVDSKGKGREKVGVEPAVSIVMEENSCPMSQGVAKMELEDSQQNHVSSQGAAKNRPVLASKSNNIIPAELVYKQCNTGPSTSKALFNNAKASSDTAIRVRGKPVSPAVQSPRITESMIAEQSFANVTYTEDISVCYSPRSRPQRTLAKVNSGDITIADSQAMEGDESKTLSSFEKQEESMKVNQDDEEQYWDDDRSMEMALSQLVIPEAAPSSQAAVVEKSQILAGRPASMEVDKPKSQESKNLNASLKPLGGDSSEKWSGYARRDKRTGSRPVSPAEMDGDKEKAVEVKQEKIEDQAKEVKPVIKQEIIVAREKPSKATTAVAPKPGLSSRPLGTVVNHNAASMKMKTVPAGLPKKASSPVNNKAVPLAAKTTSTSGMRLPCNVSAASSQPRNASTSTTAARTGTLNRTAGTSSERLYQPFRPPVIRDAGKAKAAKETWKTSKIAAKAPAMNPEELGLHSDDFASDDAGNESW